MAASTITQEVENISLPLPHIQQLITTLQCIDRSTLTRITDTENSIECLPNTDPADKSNDLVARKLINVREAELHSSGVLPLPNDLIVEFLKDFNLPLQMINSWKMKPILSHFPPLNLKTVKASLYTIS